MRFLLGLTGGAGIAAGLLLIWNGLFTRPAQAPARPPSPLIGWLRRPLQPRARRHTLIAVAVTVLVLAVTRWPAAALAAGAAAAALPAVMSNRSISRQLDRLDAIEQWVRKLAGLLGASHALEDALQTSALHAPEPIRAEIQALARRLRGGASAEEALYRLADDLNDPVGDLVAIALIEASQVRGRGVQQLLQDLAGMVADDVAGRREVESSRAPHRTTVKGMLIIFILFGALLAYRRDYSAAYSTMVGQMVLAVLLGVCAAGLFVMYRLAHRAPVSRFLVEPPPEPPEPHGGPRDGAPPGGWDTVPGGEVPQR